MKWDIARAPFTCAGSPHLVGQGEAYRVSAVAKRIGYCEECSRRLFGEAAPDHIEPRTFAEQLRDSLVRRPVRPGPTPVRAGSQAAFDPRAQRYRRRHGVVEAIRATTETDWRMRRAGERE